MEFRETRIDIRGIKIEILDESGIVIGHCYLYLLENDLHKSPFGFMEDVFVEEEFRNKGVGSKLVLKCADVAKREGCYKLIGTFREDKAYLRIFYERYGFKISGFSFRRDF